MKKRLIIPGMELMCKTPLYNFSKKDKIERIIKDIISKDIITNDILSQMLKEHGNVKVDKSDKLILKVVDGKEKFFNVTKCEWLNFNPLHNLSDENFNNTFEVSVPKSITIKTGLKLFLDNWVEKTIKTIYISDDHRSDYKLTFSKDTKSRWYNNGSPQKHFSDVFYNAGEKTGTYYNEIPISGELKDNVIEKYPFLKLSESINLIYGLNSFGSFKMMILSENSKSLLIYETYHIDAKLSKRINDYIIYKLYQKNKKLQTILEKKRKLIKKYKSFHNLEDGNLPLKEDGLITNFSVLSNRLYTVQLTQEEMDLIKSLRKFDCCCWDNFNFGFEMIIKFYQKDTTEDTWVPSGPDTSKFRSLKSGDISLMKKENISGGYYGVNKYIHIGIKIGSNAKSSNIRAVTLYFINMLFECGEIVGYSNQQDAVVSRVETNGTAWSAIGIG